jgi:hypothetical protein
MFVLKDLRFEVENATLLGHVYDPYPYEGNWTLCWSINISMKERDVDGEIWCPRLYHDSFRLAVRRWFDVSEQPLVWDAAFNSTTGEPNGGLYVFEHGDIPQATLRFLERNGRNLKVDWTGKCNVFWDERYGENIPFTVETTVRFDYVDVRGTAQDNDATLLERLALFLDPGDFVQHPIQFDDPKLVNSTYSIFEPK